MAGSTTSRFPRALMQDLTTGPLIRHLLKTTSFMLVMMVFQTLYFLIDLYWVGRLGTDAVAAVGIAGNVSFLVLAFTQMLARARLRSCRKRLAARTTTRPACSSINRKCSRCSPGLRF